MTDWPTGFMLIHSNRLESLCHLMVAWLKRHPLTPLENETILVQSNGIAQWVKLMLARNPNSADDGGCGIAAAVRVMLPAQFLWQAYRSVLGALEEQSPFDKAPLTWRLYHLFGDVAALERRLGTGIDFSAVTAFLSTPAANADQRRYQLAQRLADLYDQYQVYRADWLTAWQRGDNELINTDGSHLPLPPDQRWQAALWRCLIADIAHDPQLITPAYAPPCYRYSRAQIHTEFLQQVNTLTAATRPLTLPRRIIVFGVSSLPCQTLEMLSALRTVSQVLLFVHNPSRHYWGDLIEGRHLFRHYYRRTAVRAIPANLDDSQLHIYGQPLLAAWGKQGRDYIRLLDEYDHPAQYQNRFTAAQLPIDVFESPGEDTLLHQLQTDILELRPLTERQALATAIDPASDQSVQFLMAYSPQREIEILHDQLLAVLARDHPNNAAPATPLQPRDILIMVPDIAVYAPHIEAVFGRLTPDDPRYLPFHVADQGQRQRHPLLLGLEQLLTLPQSRFSVTELLALLDIAAVQARFELDAAALLRLRQWITGANIRWGLDAAQRASLALITPAADTDSPADDTPANDTDLTATQYTWAFGLKRLLLGMAVGQHGAWRGIEPYGGIGGLETALLGQLVQLLEQLERDWHLLAQPATPADWVARLVQLLADYFTATDDSDESALRQIQNTLEYWLRTCQHGGLTTELLPLVVVREALFTALDLPTLNQRFFAGSINFATLMPMRAIPFRHIWLLGMNDGEYPRIRHPVDFDLMAAAYRPGDRSRREDDRYLFLEALLSAREQLVLSWIGRSIQDDGPRAPSVLVEQLRDHIAAGWQLAQPAAAAPAAGTALVAALTVTHPLQPFSRQYFAPAGDPRLFTYAHEWRQAHTPPAAAPVTALSPWAPATALTLQHLKSFLQQPQVALLQERLGIRAPAMTPSVADVEPFTLDGLAKWHIAEAVLPQLLTPDVTADTLAEQWQRTIATLQARGQVLAGSHGQLQLAALGERLPALQADWADIRAQYPQPLPPRSIRFTVPLAQSGLPAQLCCEDTLTALHRGATGDAQLIVQASHLVKDSKYQWKVALGPWLQHLAAQLAGEPVTTYLFTPVGSKTFAPLAAADAEQLLTTLLRSWWLGMQSPLPVTVKTAQAWLSTNPPPATLALEQLRLTPAWTAAMKKFEGECEREPYLARCYSEWECLWANGAFAYWAEQLYAPLQLQLGRVAK